MLAQYGRIQTGGHREEVPGRITVVEAGQVVGELLGRHMGHLGEEVADVLVRTVELLGEYVHLDPVAGRQDHGLVDVLARREVGQRLGQARRRDRHALEQVERHGAVVETYDYDRQGPILLVLRLPGPRVGWSVLGRMAGVVKPLSRSTAFPMRAVLSNPWPRYVPVTVSTTDI